MEFNPPFGYSLVTYEWPLNSGSEHILCGLGNGSIVKFKKKKLTMEQYHSDIHLDQISCMLLDKDESILVTGSNDMSLGWHKLDPTAEQVIKSTDLKLGIESKLNSFCGSSRVLYTGDVNGAVKMYEVK